MIKYKSLLCCAIICSIVQFSILNNSCTISTGCIRDDEEWDALSKILAYSYILHQCHLTSQAVKLYNLLNNLLTSGWGGNPILLFLANLAGEVQDNSMKVSHVSCFILV